MCVFLNADIYKPIGAVNHMENTIKNKLNAHRQLIEEIEVQELRLERIETKLASFGVSVLSDMPKASSMSYDRIADLIVQKDAINESIKSAALKLKNEREEIEKLIEHLSQAKEKTVIRGRYIDGDSWSDVCELIFGGKQDFLEKEDSYMRRTYKIHQSAISNMAKITEEQKQ